MVRVNGFILIGFLVINFIFVFWLVYKIIDLSVTIDLQGQSIKLLTEQLSAYGIKP
jgi:hypothetical protein